MGFYYSPSTPPDDGDERGSFKEALLITWTVFRALSVPLLILFGGMAGLLLLFWLFAMSPLAGLAGILVIVAAIAAFGFWEYRHPPNLE